MMSVVSSTESVVWVRYASCSVRGSGSSATSSTVCTSTIASGASPIVPTTSSCPAWPIRKIVKPWPAKRRASLCTLVTSGQVASIARSRAQRGVAVHLGRDAVRREHDGRALRHVLLALDEDRALLLEPPHDVDVVHDLLAHVDRRAVQDEHLLDRLDRALHAGAVPARAREQQTARDGWPRTRPKRTSRAVHLESGPPARGTVEAIVGSGAS